jgi:hypothetical protein
MSRLGTLENRNLSVLDVGDSSIFMLGLIALKSYLTSMMKSAIIGQMNT